MKAFVTALSNHSLRNVWEKWSDLEAPKIHRSSLNSQFLYSLRGWLLADEKSRMNSETEIKVVITASAALTVFLLGSAPPAHAHGGGHGGCGGVIWSQWRAESQTPRYVSSSSHLFGGSSRQPVDQLSVQPTGQPAEQSVEQSVDQSVNQSSMIYVE